MKLEISPNGKIVVKVKSSTVAGKIYKALNGHYGVKTVNQNAFESFYSVEVILCDEPSSDVLKLIASCLE